MAQAPMSTKEAAEQLHTDPRTLRRFLRAVDGGVGQGQRYQLPSTKRQFEQLRRRFEMWSTK